MDGTNYGYENGEWVVGPVYVIGGAGSLELIGGGALKGGMALLKGVKWLLKGKRTIKTITAPKGWITKTSKKDGGTVFQDPSNPHNIIRQMPGNPKSPNPAQRDPYVKFMKNGKFYDVNGNPLNSGNLPEAHIPLNKFNINKIPKF